MRERAAGGHGEGAGKRGVTWRTKQHGHADGDSAGQNAEHGVAVEELDNSVYMLRDEGSVKAAAVHDLDMHMPGGNGAEAEADADFVFNLVVLGDARTGKTSLLRALAGGGTGRAGQGPSTTTGAYSGSFVRVSERLSCVTLLVRSATCPPPELDPRFDTQTGMRHDVACVRWPCVLAGVCRCGSEF